MAQKVEVTMLDDLEATKGNERPADTTVTFGLDGKTYEIDLSDANAAKLRKALAPFVDAARSLRGKERAKSAGQGKKARGADRREETKSIRQWAKDQGYDISERGRIPSDVVEAYHAATGR